MSDPKINIEMNQGGVQDNPTPSSSPKTGKPRVDEMMAIEEAARNEEHEGLLLDKGLKEIHDEEVKKKIIIVIGVVVGLVLLVLGAAFAVYFIKFHSESTTSPSTTSPTTSPTASPTTIAPHPDPVTLLLISLDGFRYNYLDIPGAKVENLKKLIHGGSKAEYLKPVFPSKTFPNHYAIVTGLHPPFHGIVSNTFYDPVFNQTFTLANGGPTDAKWWNGEPVWVTAQKQNHTTATMFWPGSEAPIQGVRPHYWAHYDKNFAFDKRVQQLFEWVDSTPRPTFLTLYLEGVDTAGHLFGPGSPQVLEAINHVDETIGLVLDNIEARKLKNMQIIVVSDHGMTNLNNNTVIFLDDYIDMTKIKVVEFSPILCIIPTELSQDEVFEKLSGKHPNMTVYKKQEMPERFIYNQSRRITPIIGVADEGWTIATKKPNFFVPGGNHGYDNLIPNMWGIFIANGHLFKQNHVFPHFQNVNIYNLMCKILDLKPASNNGTDVLFDLLNNPS